MTQLYRYVQSYRIQELYPYSFDLVNMYGTYNIQPTSDTENTFPLIAPGLPKAYRNMKLNKHDLEL